MKHLILILLSAVALVAQPTLVHPDEWVLGTEFPATPKESTKRTNTPRGDVVETQLGYENTGNEVFMMERTQYPISIPSERREAAYEGGKRGMLRARPGIIVSEERISICGHEGRRYLVERNDGKRLTDHRVVIIGDEVYQFIYERFTNTKDSPDAKRFFSRITKKNG